MNGVELIAAERTRQIDVEGWMPDHDDQHSQGELARAAKAMGKWAAGASIVRVAEGAGKEGTNAD